MAESNFEQYRTHYVFLESRFGTLHDRLSMLSTWTFQPIAGTPVGNLGVCVSLLDIYISKAAIVPPNALEYYSTIRNAVAELSAIYKSAQVDWEAFSDEEANIALGVYWTHREVIYKTLNSLLQIHSITEALESIVPDIQQMQNSIDKAVETIRISIEILAQPSQPDIPQTILTWNKRLTEIRHDLVNNNVVPAYESMLIEGCQHSFAPIRRDSVGLLGYYSSKSVVETLLICCMDSDYEVRRQAILSLCQQQRDDERIVNTLIVALSDINDEVCASALDALRRIKPQKALHPLIDCLNRKFKNAAYTGWVGSALAEIPDPIALQPLVDKLDEEIKSTTYHDRNFHPLAGLYNAIKAIGGKDANDVLNRYFD